VNRIVKGFLGLSEIVIYCKSYAESWLYDTSWV
jgi:hypothetical protein